MRQKMALLFVAFWKGFSSQTCFKLKQKKSKYSLMSSQVSCNSLEFEVSCFWSTSPTCGIIKWFVPVARLIHWPSLQDYFVDIPMHRRVGDLRKMQHGQMHSELNTNKVWNVIRSYPEDIHWPFLVSSIVKTMSCIEAGPPALRLSIRI